LLPVEFFARGRAAWLASRNTLQIETDRPLRLSVDGRTLHHFAVRCKIFFIGLQTPRARFKVVSNPGQNVNGAQNRAKSKPNKKDKENV
jgi:hypothetical protein